MYLSHSAWLGAVVWSLIVGLTFGCCLSAAATIRADVPAKCTFDLAQGAAEKTLRAFSEQSGCSLILATSVTEGVRTNAVRGEFTPREALTRMLAGTGLIGIEDAKNGAFTVRREKDHDHTDASGSTTKHGE